MAPVSRGGQSFFSCIALAAFLWLTIGSVSTATLASSRLDPDLFPVPVELRPNVAFWVEIYSRYSSDQAVLHDERHLDVVYRVVELADLNRDEPSAERLRKLRQKRIEDARDEVIATLESLASGGAAGSPEAKRSSEPRGSSFQVKSLPSLRPGVPYRHGTLRR